MEAQAQPQGTDRVKLVVGVDFTDASEYALRLAENLVKPARDRAEIHIVHVTPPVYWPTVQGGVPAFVPSEDADVTRRRLIDACFGSGKDVAASIVPHVRMGDVTDEIAEVARSVHADLIVVGAHKRKGLARALHRSTYARIVRLAPCSVLTALPREDDLPEDDGVRIEPPCSACVAARRDSDGESQWCAHHTGRHVHAHLHRAAPDPNASGAWTFRT